MQLAAHIASIAMRGEFESCPVHPSFALTKIKNDFFISRERSPEVIS